MGAARWPQRALTWRDRMSLRAKFSLLLGLVAAAPLLLVGPVLVRDSRDALRADARAQATATAQLGAGLARRYLVDARNVLEELAGRPLIVAAVAAGDADFVQAALERHLRQYDEQFANFNWLDTDAVLRASAEPSAALGSRLGGTSFDESLKRLDTYVGRPAPSRVTGEPIVPM